MNNIALKIKDKKKIIERFGKIYREMDEKEILDFFDEAMGYACRLVIDKEIEKNRLSFREDFEKIKSLTKSINQTLMSFKE